MNMKQVGREIIRKKEKTNKTTNGHFLNIIEAIKGKKSICSKCLNTNKTGAPIKRKIN